MDAGWITDMHRSLACSSPSQLLRPTFKLVRQSDHFSPSTGKTFGLAWWQWVGRVSQTTASGWNFNFKLCEASKPSKHHISAWWPLWCWYGSSWWWQNSMKTCYISNNQQLSNQCLKSCPKNVTLGSKEGTFVVGTASEGEERRIAQNWKKSLCAHFLIKLVGTNTNTGRRQTQKQGTKALFWAIFGISSGELSIDHNLSIPQIS